MKEGVFLLLILTIWANMNETEARANITGPGTNLTALFLKIWLKGIGEWIPNLLPDTTFNDKTRDRKPGVDAAVGRRTLKDFIAVQRKYFIDASDMFMPNYQKNKDTSLSEMTDNTGVSLKDIGLRILTAIGLRKDGRRSEKREQRILVNKQHVNKINELRYYMHVNYKSTDYFYEEIKRIKKTGVVRDPLRMMVEYLGKHGTDSLIKYAFKCFHDRRLIDRSVPDIWKHGVPNNLNIDPMKDPYSFD